MDLERYLARIGWAGARAPSAATLRGLCWAHARSIPFENLDVLLGRPIRVELEAVTRKLVDDRRGGYCFEQNTLFAGALRALGFRVTTLAARVRWGAAPDQVTARTHMVLRVDVDGERWLADVGFGGTSPPEPLRLLPGIEQPTRLESYRVMEAGAGYQLEVRLDDAWVPLYQLTLEEHHPIDYVVASHYTSTHPDSHFTRGIVVARLDEGVRFTLRGRELGVRRGGVVTRRTIDDDDELLAELARTFGLVFPPGTRFVPRQPSDQLT